VRDHRARPHDVGIAEAVSNAAFQLTVSDRVKR
jgi:hypothetical protein